MSSPVLSPGSPPPWMSSARMQFTMDDLGAQRRRLVRELEQHRLSPATAYDAAVVLGELLSNALRHAAPLDDGGLTVTWGAWDGMVHLEVTDGGSGTLPTIAVADAPAVGGHGLVIVEALSTSWGIRAEEDSVTVWADLPARESAA